MKRFVVLLTVIIILLRCTVSVFSHGRNEHDEELEYVLFGSRDYALTHPAISDKIKALEDAVYLCVDQYNGVGAEQLKNLQDRKIPGLPKSISEIDFTGNYSHRKYTHRGWNLTSYDVTANWPVRQKILLNTVERELFSSGKGLLSPLTDIFGGGRDKSKTENFSALLYYVHVLGDHIEADNYGKLGYVIPLSRQHESSDNPGLITELTGHLQALFMDQANTRRYGSLMQEIRELWNVSDSVVNTDGEVNTTEKFDVYHKCAIDLLDTLAVYVPEMLKGEDFFRNAFDL